MTKSMTAFGRAEHGSAVWEIRSVNHRYLDVNFRMSDSYRFLEADLKAAFKDKVSRGKLECTLKFNAAELPAEIGVNESLVKELTEALNQIQTLSGLESRGDAMALMRWPDVLTNTENTEAVVNDVKQAFIAAVASLAEMRAREGRELAEMIESRLVEVESTVAVLKEEAPVIIKHQHDKLQKKIEEISSSVDPARLEQELVILSQKLDVMEELDRLLTHVAEVRRTLTQTEPVGRRLDFLMQELNREANTLSSKAAASSTTHHAVDLKVIIEQMREQIQNIE